MNQSAIYRPLFLAAWKKTWEHKRLWLLGIFATAMASGGLFESISGHWRAAIHWRTMIEQCLNGTLPGYEWLVSYNRYLTGMPPLKQYGLATAIVLIIVGIIIVGVASQGALLASSLEKRPLDLNTLVKKSSVFFWSILSLDILGKLAMGIIFIITVAPIVLINPLPFGWQQYPPFISLTLFLIGAVFVTAMQMLSLVGVVSKHLNPLSAISEAWDIFRFHILVTFELGFLLAFTSVVAVIFTMLFLFALAIPLTLLFFAATALASPSLYLITIFFSVILIVAVILLASGALTTFQYTVWSLYFEEAGRFGIVSKIRKWLKR
jgi:hypothetical protein